MKTGFAIDPLDRTNLRAGLLEIHRDGCRVGLQMAAKAAAFLSDTLVDGLGDTATPSEGAYAERKAQQIEQAILGLIDD